MSKDSTDILNFEYTSKILLILNKFYFNLLLIHNIVVDSLDQF